jgi:hypothetical protein
MGNSDFEKDTDEAYDRAKAGAKAVKKITEDAVKDLGNKLEKVGNNLEAEYRKQKQRAS